MKIPYIEADAKIKDFSLKSLIAGIIFGAIFGSANAYLGLKVGLTISTAIPLAVISVALFKFLKPVLGDASILEYNITQTAGSSSSSLASGVIFTIPALFMWGFNPSLFQITALAIAGGVLGILFMIPLREFLIVKEHKNLPYPEGTAAAEVLIAAEEGGTTAKYVFSGLGIGALYKAFLSFVKVIPDSVALRMPIIPKAMIELETMPALLGVGYILNYRVSAIMVAGGFLSWLVIIPTIAYFGQGVTTPLFPETVKTISQMGAGEIWTRYVRYIGAGAVAFAGILTVIKSIPTMWDSLKIGIKEIMHIKEHGIMGRERIRTEKNIPMAFVFVGVIVVILFLILVPHIIGVKTTFTLRLIASFCIAIFAFMFVTVSSRIVGLIGVSSNPTSGMTIVTLLGTSLIFYLLGWTDNFGKAAAVTIGTVVCVAASIAGDISQDLKSGYLLGATPMKQQTAELLGAIFSATFVCLAVWVLGETFTFGSSELPAPQATLMKTVVDGVLSANLPWGLVIIGAFISLFVELLGIPSLPFAVGVYLPVSAMTPVFLGGIVRKAVDNSKKNSTKEDVTKAKEQGVLLSSGLIAGEGIMGIAIAVYAFLMEKKPQGFGFFMEGATGEIISFALFLALAFYLYRVGKKQ